jgi:hypothetical protein
MELALLNQRLDQEDESSNHASYAWDRRRTRSDWMLGINVKLRKE